MRLIYISNHLFFCYIHPLFHSIRTSSAVNWSSQSFFISSSIDAAVPRPQVALMNASITFGVSPRRPYSPLLNLVPSSFVRS